MEQYHGTTILSVRRGTGWRSAAMGRSRSAISSSRPPRARCVASTRRRSSRASPAARPTLHLFERLRRSSRSTRASAAQRGRARQGLAHRPHAAPPRSDAGGGRPGQLADHHRQRRCARTGARHRRDRQRRRLCPVWRRALCWKIPRCLPRISSRVRWRLPAIYASIPTRAIRSS